MVYHLKWGVGQRKICGCAVPPSFALRRTGMRLSGYADKKIKMIRYFPFYHINLYNDKELLKNSADETGRIGYVSNEYGDR